MGQLVEHLLRRLSPVYVHFFKLLFNLIIFAISLFGPTNNRPSFLPAERFIEMIVNIDRFDECEIKHGVTAVAAMDLTTNAILVLVLHRLEDLVNLRNQGLVFLKRL